MLGVSVRDVHADAHLPVGDDRPDLRRLAHQLRHRRIDVPWILDYRTREALLRDRTRLERLA